MLRHFPIIVDHLLLNAHPGLHGPGEVTNTDGVGGNELGAKHAIVVGADGDDRIGFELFYPVGYFCERAQHII